MLLYYALSVLEERERTVRVGVVKKCGVGATLVVALGSINIKSTLPVRATTRVAPTSQPFETKPKKDSEGRSGRGLVGEGLFIGILLIQPDRLKTNKLWIWH